MPRYTAKQISGSDANIRHYIGEMYFLRAYEYFKRYQMFGDFPIVRNTGYPTRPNGTVGRSQQTLAA